MKEPNWLTWAKQLQALSQTGLTYGPNQFDKERYKRIREIAAEMMAAHVVAADGGMVSAETILEWYQQDSGYACPKVGVRAAVVRHVDGEPELLLTQELAAGGLWTLPGGFVDVGDTPAEGAVRETFEETGYSVKITKLIGVFYRNVLPQAVVQPIDLIQFLFLAEVVSGEPKPSIETGESRFFKHDAIPQLERKRTNPIYMPMIFKHFAEPSLPTEFN